MMDFQLVRIAPRHECLECRSDATHVLVNDAGLRFGYFCETCGETYGHEMAKDEGGKFTKKEESDANV